MSDNVLSVIPQDIRTGSPTKPRPTASPHSSPGSSRRTTPASTPRSTSTGTTPSWPSTAARTSVRIGCPQCGATISDEWYQDLLEAHGDDGFAVPAVKVPCCGAAETLDALEYDGPCGFARFEIAVWNSDREPFDDGELIALGAALGHPVRQVLARI